MNLSKLASDVSKRIIEKLQGEQLFQEGIGKQDMNLKEPMEQKRDFGQPMNSVN